MIIQTEVWPGLRREQEGLPRSRRGLKSREGTQDWDSECPKPLTVPAHPGQPTALSLCARIPDSFDPWE